MAHPGRFFVYFHSFQTIYRVKTVDISRIQTRIVRVEGKHADQLTTTRAPWVKIVWLNSDGRPLKAT